MEEGIVILFNAELLEKISFSKEVKLLGNFTSIKFSHLENALSPIDVTESGTLQFLYYIY